MRKPRLPKVIFVYEQADEGGQRWFNAEENIDECADIGAIRQVGRYELVEKLNVRAEIKTEVQKV